MRIIKRGSSLVPISQTLGLHPALPAQELSETKAQQGLVPDPAYQPPIKSNLARCEAENYVPHTYSTTQSGAPFASQSDSQCEDTQTLSLSTRLAPRRDLLRTQSASLDIFQMTNYMQCKTEASK